MITLSCSNITKYYVDDLILKDISFTIKEKEKIGLIGANGSGKTTLFKILTRKIPYDSGDIYIAKNTTIGYLKQNVDYKDDISIYDACLPTFKDLIDQEKKLRAMEKQITQDHTNEKLMTNYSNQLDLFEKNGGYEYKSKIRGILSGLGFSPDEYDTSVNILSGGQKSRLRLGLLLLENPDILLLDEPTNHLDLEATNWLENFLLDYSGSVLIITHDRYFLDKVTNKIFELENNKLLEYEGNFSAFQKYKKELKKQQLNKFNKQKKEIEKQKEIIRRYKQRGTEKLAKRAKSREKRLEKMDLIDKPESFNPKLRLQFEPTVKSGDEILKAKNLAKSFDSLLFQNLNFEIFKGEKIGLIGPNGVGKTTLFRMILEKETFYEGEIKLGHNVFPGYFDQEQENLTSDNTVFEEVLEVIPKATNTEIRNYLALFLFTGEEVFKSVSTLSGGEKGRLSLLKIMLSKTNFILLDEPTNHLDISSKEALEEALNNYNGTLLIISHDRYFLNKVTNKTFEFTKNSINTYLGNYDYYVEKKELNKQLSLEDPVNQKTQTQLKKEKRAKKKHKKLLRQKKKRQQEILEEIELLEKTLHENEQRMCEEEVYSDGDKMKALTYENKEVERQINQLYEKWSEIDIFLESQKNKTEE